MSRSRTKLQIKNAIIDPDAIFALEEEELKARTEIVAKKNYRKELNGKYFKNYSEGNLRQTNRHDSGLF
jgi:hypothetical protein